VIVSKFNIASILEISTGLEDDVFLLLVVSLASGFYVRMFWNTLFHLHRQCKYEFYKILHLP
jgi:hypothetical protein